MEKEQRLELLRSAIDRTDLSELERKIVKYLVTYWSSEHTGGGLPNKELAELLGVSRKAVRKARSPLATKIGFKRGM